jgi:O-antigen/teichoic acid export membrane protein
MAEGKATDMVRGSLISVGVRLLDLPSRYGFHLLIAAKLGVAQAGSFYIVFSTMTVLAGFGRLSIDRAMTRQVAIARARGREGDVTRILRLGFFQIFCASALISLAMALLAHPFADLVLHKSDLARPLMLGALVLIPQNLGSAAAGGLAGLQRIGFSQMIYSWLWPSLFCLVALFRPLEVDETLLLIAASFAVTAIIGTGLLLGLKKPGGQDSGEAVPLLRPALSLFTLELSQLCIAGAPAIILGMVAGTDKVGLFALAWRIALLVNVLVSGIASMASPRFAELYARGDVEGLSRAASHAVGLGLGLSLAPVVVMLVAPTFLLGLVGNGFTEGAATLRILAIGQLCAACFTAMPELLGMTDHLADLRRINALSLLTLIVGCAALAPLLDNDGAALATSAAILVNSAGSAWAARRQLGVAPLHRLFAVWRQRRAGLGLLLLLALSGAASADERPPRFDVDELCSRAANSPDGLSSETLQRCLSEQGDTLDRLKHLWPSVPDYIQRDCQARIRARHDDNYDALEKCVKDQIRQDSGDLPKPKPKPKTQTETPSG